MSSFRLKVKQTGISLIEGTIVDGESLSIPLLGINNVGGDTVATTLRTLREDPACRGIILRGNSPGGAALASDIIWREVDLTRMAHDEDPRKPAVVVSMGDVAASGGYYVAAGARDIFALPTTITGSIGVILRGNDLSRVFERIGIRFDTVKSGPFKDILSPDRPLSDAERALLQELIDSSYDQFVGVVADGRGMSREAVKAFADGRVFSGAQAKELGLVDELGDEEHARRLAARLAELDEELRPVTLGKSRRKLTGLLPGSQLIQQLQNRLCIELMGSGQVLWLYRP